MTSIFRRAHIDKEKLRQILLKNPQALGEGISFIDIGLGTEEEGIIDFLGVDKKGKLVIVNFDAEANDLILLDSLSQMHWLKRNESLIKRLFFSENIDFSYPAQILLIGPSFSEKLIAAVNLLRSLEIKLLEFKYIVGEAKDGILLEEPPLKSIYKRPKPQVVNEAEVMIEKSVPIESITKDLENKEVKQDFILQDISLSPQEIAEFMDFEKTLEEKKISA